MQGTLIPDRRRVSLRIAMTLRAASRRWRRAVSRHLLASRAAAHLVCLSSSLSSESLRLARSFMSIVRELAAVSACRPQCVHRSAQPVRDSVELGAAPPIATGLLFCQQSHHQHRDDRRRSVDDQLHCRRRAQKNLDGAHTSTITRTTRKEPALFVAIAEAHCANRLKGTRPSRTTSLAGIALRPSRPTGRSSLRIWAR